jgi:hypothetical protein
MHKFNSNREIIMQRSRMNKNFNPQNGYHSTSLTPGSLPGIVQPDIVQPDIVQPDIVQPDIVQPDTRYRSGVNKFGSHRSGPRQSYGPANETNFKEKYQNRYRETNQELIKYIYSTIDISKFKYDLLKYEHQLSTFITDTYYIAPNFYGKNCFLVFTKMKAITYAFMIDRRQLSYNLENVNFDNVFVQHCNADIDITIYAGTIFDGVYIKKGNVHEFIITDVYYFKGTDYTEDRLKNKLFEVQMYLDNVETHTGGIRDKINSKINLDLKVNKLHDVTDIKNFMDNDMKAYEKNYQIRGICFYPNKSGTKMIHLIQNNDRDEKFNRNDINHENKKNDPVNMLTTSILVNSTPNPKYLGYPCRRDNSTPNPKDLGYPCRRDNSTLATSTLATSTLATSTLATSTLDGMRSNKCKGVMRKSKSLIKKVYVAKTNDPIYAVLEMKNTKTADNYKLFAVEQVVVGEAIRLKKCQMDIAYIPDMKKSNWCRDITTNSHKGSVFVRCIWREDKKKWEPLEVKGDVRLPSLMEDIRKYLIEMEESDSDSDVE